MRKFTRLNLLCLEDRLAMSTLPIAEAGNVVAPVPAEPEKNYWISSPITGGTTYWDYYANWSLGRAPTKYDIVVFDGNYSTEDCDYSGRGEWVADSIFIEANYGGTVTFSASDWIWMNNLVMKSGEIVQVGEKASLNVYDLKWSGGNINKTGILNELNVMDSFEVTGGDVTLGSSLYLRSGSSNIINMQESAGITFVRDATVTNYGSVKHSQGSLDLFSTADNPPQVQKSKVTNYGSWTIDTNDATFMLPFINKDDNAVLKVSGVTAFFHEKAMEDYVFQQRGGKIQLEKTGGIAHNSDILISGGVVETLDATYCAITSIVLPGDDPWRVEMKDVSIYLDNVAKSGKGHLVIGGILGLSGTTKLYINAKDNSCDNISAIKIELGFPGIDTVKLFVTDKGGNTKGTVLEFMTADTDKAGVQITGGFSSIDLPMGWTTKKENKKYTLTT